MAEKLVLGDLIYRIGSEITGFVNGLGTAETRLGKFGNLITKNSAQLRQVGMAATVVGGVIVGALGIAVKSSVEFDQALRNAFSIVEKGGTTLEQVKETTMEWGRTTVFTCTEAAAAYYKLGSAGLSHQEIVNSGAAAIKFAVATTQEFDSAAETLTTTIKGFNLDFEKTPEVANIFAAAIAGSNLNAGRLTESLKWAIPACSSFGESLKDTTSYLMLFHDKGMMGTLAGNSLNQALLALASPSDKAIDKLGTFGVTMDQISPKTHTMKEIIIALSEAGMKGAEAYEVFGRRGGRAMAIMLNAYQDNNAIFDEYIEKLNDATALETMYLTQMEGAENIIKLFTSAVQYLKITIGDMLLPELKKITIAMTEWIRGIAEWVKRHPDLTSAIVKFSLAMGGVLLVLGPFLIMLPGFVTLLGAVKTVAIAGAAAFKLLGVSMGAAGLAATASGALMVAALVIAIRNVYRLIEAYGEMKAAQELAAENELQALQAQVKLKQEIRKTDHDNWLDATTAMSQEKMALLVEAGQEEIAHYGSLGEEIKAEYQGLHDTLIGIYEARKLEAPKIEASLQDAIASRMEEGGKRQLEVVGSAADAQIEIKEDVLKKEKAFDSEDRKNLENLIMRSRTLLGKAIDEFNKWRKKVVEAMDRVRDKFAVFNPAYEGWMNSMVATTETAVASIVAAYDTMAGTIEQRLSEVEAALNAAVGGSWYTDYVKKFVGQTNLLRGAAGLVQATLGGVAGMTGVAAPALAGAGAASTATLMAGAASPMSASPVIHIHNLAVREEADIHRIASDLSWLITNRGIS